MQSNYFMFLLLLLAFIYQAFSNYFFNIKYLFFIFITLINNINYFTIITYNMLKIFD